MSKVVVIGGGAAGMFASIAAAGCGHQVVVYEKNEKLGKKLYITGKGRCNITNACDMEGLFDAVRTNAKFLYSSFYGYTNQQVIDFFERIGVPTKIERGDRVFPVSDHSSDVIRGLEREMDRLGVKVHLRTAGADIIMLDNMSTEEMQEAIRIIDGRAETECSGNVTKENISRLTSLGVDYISSGALTHSAPILDISLKHLHAV